jgi:hypothetical protein
LFSNIVLSLMVAAVQCQDCGGLGSFHDIRKKLARSFFGGLPWHGDYFSMLASLIQIVSLTTLCF